MKMRNERISVATMLQRYVYCHVRRSTHIYPEVPGFYEIPVTFGIPVPPLGTVDVTVLAREDVYRSPGSQLTGVSMMYANRCGARVARKFSFIGKQ